ncbi:MAG: NAD(P)/FAD-dependent oxidoreductase [Chloroflexia bacterium]
MEERSQVVVIGAGIIGCSTAYHLAALGVSEITLLEMDQPGSGTSSKSASMLSLQFCQDEALLPLALYSYERYMAFEEEIGSPTDFCRTGWLTVAGRANAGKLLEAAHLLRSYGVTTEILTPEEIAYRYPEIHTADLVVGTYGPDDGPFDAHMILWGYLRKAREMGVRLRQGVRATGIRVRSGRVEGVETDRGFFPAPMVVNAAGPWAAEVGRWVGIDVPQDNRARCIWVTRPFPYIPQDRPFVEELDGEWYYRREGPGILIGMGSVPVDRFDVELSDTLRDTMIERVVHRVPVLARASIQTSWTGVRPLSRDGRPIVGPVPSIEGLFLNTGWGGMGLIQAPAAGRLLAEYIVQGEPTTFDARPFAFSRFLNGAQGPAQPGRKGPAVEQ